MRKITLLILLLSFLKVNGQLPSDSVEANYLRKEGINITEGNSVRLLTNGHAKFEDMFQEIRRAKDFIHMEYFNFRNDSINHLLTTLLTEKVKEGVEVRVIYDDFGNLSNNQPIKKHQHDSIAALGIQIVKFDPIKFPWVNHIFPRDHRKIVVIDGRVGYTGGMNVADYYIDGLPEIGPWRDLHLHLEGPVVRELHEIFLNMWEEVTGEHLLRGVYSPEFPAAGEAKVAIVDRWPHKTPKSIRKLYVSMLDNAQESIQIINPYFVPTHQVRAALKRAIDRGIDVQILLSAQSDIVLTPDASHYFGNNLAKRGAKVYLFHKGFHHTKAMIVDHRFCTIGSSNLDSRSLRCDYEVNAVIMDHDATAQLDSIFQNDLTSSTLMQPGDWKKRSLGKRFVGWFGNLLTPFL